MQPGRTIFLTVKYHDRDVAQHRPVGVNWLVWRILHKRKIFMYEQNVEAQVGF